MFAFENWVSIRLLRSCTILLFILVILIINHLWIIFSFFFKKIKSNIFPFIQIGSSKAPFTCCAKFNTYAPNSILGLAVTTQGISAFSNCPQGKKNDSANDDTWNFWLDIYGSTDLAIKCVMPNSGKDCQAWINLILASMRLIWATFWWASRIRAVICKGDTEILEATDLNFRYNL